jgi:hypothetical protein
MSATLTIKPAPRSPSKVSPWRASWRAIRKARRAARLPDTIVLWCGPSSFDGTPIALVGHRVNAPSENGKTGDMVQVSIMRQDRPPIEAWKAGADGAVCPGACGHRSKPRGGSGECYVNKARLSAAWRAARREIDAGRIGWTPGTFAGARIRAGMEGDPAAVPFEVWAALLGEARGHTGYTAAWRTLPIEWSRLFMASVSSPADYLRARSKGWRPFAASASESDDRAFEAAGSSGCEADREVAALQCVACVACNGAARNATRPGRYVKLHGALGAARRARLNTIKA